MTSGHVPRRPFLCCPVPKLAAANFFCRPSHAAVGQRQARRRCGVPACPPGAGWLLWAHDPHARAAARGAHHQHGARAQRLGRRLWAVAGAGRRRPHGVPPGDAAAPPPVGHAGRQHAAVVCAGDALAARWHAAAAGKPPARSATSAAADDRQWAVCARSQRPASCADKHASCRRRARAAYRGAGAGSHDERQRAELSDASRLGWLRRGGRDRGRHPAGA